jgi:hypothetical protein
MFGATGIVRVDNAFPADIADAITEMVWATFVDRYGIERDRPQTWQRRFRKRALDQLSTAAIFDEMLTDRLASAVDRILGAEAWDRPTSWGDFLITFPNASTWTLPTGGWHQDWSFATDCNPPRWVKAFVFLNEVQPRGGGTLVVTGSHRLHGPYGGGQIVDANDHTTLKAHRRRVFNECSYLRELRRSGDDQTRRHQFMAAETNVDGIALQVVELTGQPGDVVLIHPWLVHTVAPNAADGPRFMRAPVFGDHPE